MTFREWYCQIAREMDSNIPRELVKDVLVNAIRVALEEFLANPADAELSIKGIGRFYLNHRVCHNNFPTENSPEYKTHWTIHFRPSLVLKETINGKRDHRDLMIGTIVPLYPDFVESGQGQRRKSGAKRKIVKSYRTKYTVRTRDSYRSAVNRAKREMLKNQLPQEDEDE